MVVHSIVLVHHEKEGWYRMTITSEKAPGGLGRTAIEVILSESELRGIRNEIGKIFGEKPDYSKLDEKLRRFMEGE